MNNQVIREAVKLALPRETSTYGQPPNSSNVYIPPSHIKALRLECNLVIGGRGVGKTFWSAALNDRAIRDLLGKAIPDLSRVDVRTGFSELPGIEKYPDPDIFSDLLNRNFEPYDVWRAVFSRCLAPIANVVMPVSSWRASVQWVKDNPEFFSDLLEKANKVLDEKKEAILIVFDALDRSSQDWQQMDTIVRDLLRQVLSLKRFPRLHAKVFLREDQYHGRNIANFPDASKILATRVELTWASNDLHGLLWQRLCNAPGNAGKQLRELYKDVVGVLPLRLDSSLWQLGEQVKRDEMIQRELFIRIAGKWMGKDRRRGIPYVWTVGHLADGRGRTSPRSFLLALSVATEDSMERYPEPEYPLHYDSIKHGVLKASDNRVDEVAEDYPWVRECMKPLHGLTVPCPFESIVERWQVGLSDDLRELTHGQLPPEHYAEGHSGVRYDLETLGIFETMKDGRVNMPDLYRVGFGLGRKGGVKPARKSSND